MTVDSSFVRNANHKIKFFLDEPRNQRLILGTSFCSTPFRGKLFREERASRIQEILDKKKFHRIDALWFGTNPNAPDEFKHFLENTPNTYFQGFESQLNSDWYSERKWEQNGKSVLGWNPIDGDLNPSKPGVRGWKFYSDLIGSFFSGCKDNIAMANFIPWGSSNLGEFQRELRRIDEPLATRVVKFCEDLAMFLIRELRPKIIVLPISISKDLSRILPDSALAKSYSPSNKIAESIYVNNMKRLFKYEISWVETDGCRSIILGLHHPAYAARTIGDESMRELMRPNTKLHNCIASRLDSLSAGN